jgi:hypothetical protein
VNSKPTKETWFYRVEGDDSSLKKVLGDEMKAFLEAET